MRQLTAPAHPLSLVCRSSSRFFDAHVGSPFLAGQKIRWLGDGGIENNASKSGNGCSAIVDVMRRWSRVSWLGASVATCLACGEEPLQQTSPTTTSLTTEASAATGDVASHGDSASRSVETNNVNPTSDSTWGMSHSSVNSEAASSSHFDATISTVDEPESPGDAVSSEDPGAPGVIEDLGAYLEIPRAARPQLQTQTFANIAISSAQAQEVTALLWADYSDELREERQAEHATKAIRIGEFTLRYDYEVFGQPTPTGRSLYLSLHGGGEAAASVNDSQWENQKVLYQPEEGIYLAPRAPTNTWNLWHQDHIDELFERLIQNFIVLEGVDPNRVYVMGYSAGGDGVYQLGPRMADHWAAAAAMAGHPNEAKPYSLRNIGFTIHVGEEDTAFDRNLVALEWKEALEALRTSDPEGYEHVVEVHAGKPHWMDLEDAVAVPWMARFSRNPVPSRVVWYQDDVLHDRFYWLRVTNPVKETRIDATYTGQTVSIDARDVNQAIVLLRDDMLNLDQMVTITANGGVVFEGMVPRTIATLAATLAERGDPATIFSGQVPVQW